MFKKFLLFSGVIVMISFLSGCLYPENRLAQNRVPYKDQIVMVQSAVDQFKEAEGGILPIKTKENDTPIFQKYLIDFKKLSPRFIAEPPGSAFESGGTFQYVLADVETNPTVKLIDLTMVDVIRELKLRVKFFAERNGFPPYKEPLDLEKGYFSLDYDKLGYDNSSPFIISPYTGKNLSLFIDTKGEILVDYSPDLYDALKKFKHNYKTGDDIRYILVENYDFVPAFSVPYTIKNNDPIFLKE